MQQTSAPSFAADDRFNVLGSGWPSGIEDLTSFKASSTRFEDSAMAMMDVEACNRSRYRSLYFQVTAPALLYNAEATIEDENAPNHQPKFLLLGIRICPKHVY